MKKYKVLQQLEDDFLNEIKLLYVFKDENQNNVLIVTVLLGNEGNRISIRVIHQSIPLFKRKRTIQTPPTGNEPLRSYTPQSCH
jgi:hypothetical protein